MFKPIEKPQRAFPNATRWIVLLCLVLAPAFLLTSLLSYWASVRTLRNNISSQSLPLTSDNIYSEIQKDIVQPTLISAEMAGNTFLRDWLLSGEQNINEVVRYIRSIKEKHNTITAFVVSERSHNYYYPGGIFTKVSEQNPKDKWFFRVRQMAQPYETNVEADQANSYVVTIFINYRILDYAGRFIGATGVGLNLKGVQSVLEQNEKRFGRRIYFVDRQGRLTLTGHALPSGYQNLQQIIPNAALSERILQGTNAPIGLEYRSPQGMIQVNSRFIPELNWFLIVEQNDSALIKPLRDMLNLNLLISTLATLMVLLIVVPMLRRYQSSLEQVATTDGLTGLVNRQAFDFLFDAHLRDAARSKAPFSGILLDIDYFKKINDQFGHLAGDQVIKQVSKVAREQVRYSDLMARWGGEEFFLLLKSCDLQQAQTIAESIRQKIEEHDFGLSGHQVTVSLGVALYSPNETPDQFFGRVDQALYRAKQSGRNCAKTAMSL